MIDFNIPKSSFFGLRYFFVGSIIEVLAIKGVQPIFWGHLTAGSSSEIETCLKWKLHLQNGAPTSYNHDKWPYKRVTRVITLLIGIITPFITIVEAHLVQMLNFETCDLELDNLTVRFLPLLCQQSCHLGRACSKHFHMANLGFFSGGFGSQHFDIPRHPRHPRHWAGIFTYILHILHPPSYPSFVYLCRVM